MQQNIDLALEDQELARYKDWDFSHAKPAVQNPMIRKLQENARLAQSNPKPSYDYLDEDISNWLAQQDSKTIQAVNTMLRQVMLVQS